MPSDYECKSRPTLSPVVAAAISPLFQALRNDVLGCDAVLDDHLEGYEELIPHVFFGELVTFLSENGSGSSDRERIVRPAMAAIERELREIVDVDPEDEWKCYLLTLLWTSFFENFEPLGPEFENVRREFGPLLESEYQGYLHATQSAP